MNTQLSERLGTNNSIYTHDVPPNVKRSEFPLSHKTDFHLDAGAIVPITLWETMPNDTFEINIEYILKSFPLAVAPFTSYKVRTHWYYCKLSDLWKGALTLMTKGNNQSIELEVPQLNPYYISEETPSDATSMDTPQSLMAYLGFQPKHYNIPNSNTSYQQPYSHWAELGNNQNIREISTVNEITSVSALPFMMYQKIYRYAYTIPNLLQENKVWYPDDLTDGWRINYAKTNLKNGYFKPTPFTTEENPVTDGVWGASVNDENVNLLCLRFGLFEEDRFTSALPSELRGQQPQIDISGKVEIPSTEITIPSTGIVTTDDQTISTALTTGPIGSTTITVGQMSGQSGFININPEYTNTKFITTKGNGDFKTKATTTTKKSETATATGIKMNLNQFRELVSLTVWQERNERIQAGDYNQFIYAHFKHNPKIDTHEPIYIGGSSDTIYFNDVVQTSETSGNSPLGNMAGNGATQGRANIGKFTCNDFGYIMGVMIIQPETVYSQGIDKIWTRKQQEDFYFPEDEGLGLEEILNQEIYVSGNETIDQDLFGWNERNTEYKAFNNKAKGYFALPFAEIDQEDVGFRDLSAYSQVRTFARKPSLSHQFATMSYDNLRRDHLAAPSMPAFRCSFATILRGVRPMSYRNIPQTFGF